MESPVSAFAMYSANKKPKRVRKNRRKSVSHSSPEELEIFSQDFVIQAANQLKMKQKKTKEAKSSNIGKKKTLKKKREKVAEPTKHFENKRITRDSESEGVPILVSDIPIPVVESDNEEIKSHSSTNSFEFVPVQTDSVQEGFKVFKWMIAPYAPEEFLQRIWEKRPVYISRKKPSYYKELISTPSIDYMLRKENIQFTKNIDVTSYIDGKRETHNPDGRAHPHLVWDYYLNGCSIRLLNPQTYIPKLHVLNATLQEYFNSFVGANAYLTPPDSQGFAPHYDDIEAFILQAEGKKLWRIYKPLSQNEVLPRVSSKNYDQNEIGVPILEVTLEAGDMLYFPRGYIHQGVTIDGEHSLHVTVSMYQKHSWADLFEKLVPAALQMAITENVELRRGLPLDIYDNFGLVHSDATTPRRNGLAGLVKSLFCSISKYLPIDDAVDQMHKNYQSDALPPVLTDMEKAVTVYGDTDVMVEDGKVINRVEILLETKIRLLRKNILRMVSEDKIRIYFYVENSMEYHGSEFPFFEIEENLAPGVNDLITAYPEYVSVQSLSMTSDAEKIQLADALWSRGLIMSEYPLHIIDE